MEKIVYTPFIAVFSLVAFSLFFWHQPVQAQNMQGWEEGSEYNQLYDAGEVERFKVEVKDVIEVAPLPGMAKGVGLIVYDPDFEADYTVHICPLAYKTTNTIGIRKGDKLKLRGFFTEIDGKEVIMASKIKYRDKVLKVRLTSDGKPFWTMDAAQLNKELMAAE